MHGWAKSQKLPVNGFGWVEDSSQFNEGFIKSYNEEKDKRQFFWGWCLYPEKVLKKSKSL